MSGFVPRSEYNNYSVGSRLAGQTRGTQSGARGAISRQEGSRKLISSNFSKWGPWNFTGIPGCEVTWWKVF